MQYSDTLRITKNRIFFLSLKMGKEFLKFYDVDIEKKRVSLC